MAKVKKVWADPVGSKLIAEGLKELFKWSWGALIIPLYAIIKAIVTKTSFIDSLKQTWSSIKGFFFTGFQINFLTILLIVIGYFLVTLLVKWLFRLTSRHSITSFKIATFWSAIIHWKWEKEKGEWTIKYGDYKLICPKCSHNLKFDDINGQHHLSCKNLTCDFRSGVYHFEPPSNVFIMADMNTYYFHNALTSMVDAELRKKGIKK